MPTRYLAILPVRAGVSLPDADRDPSFPRLPLVLDRPDLRLFAEGEMLVDERHGAILGELFETDGRHPVDGKGPRFWTELARSDGAALCVEHWGSYVAIVVGPGSVKLVRSPFGDLACLHVQVGDALFLASDLPLLLAASRARPAIDAPQLLRHIAWPDWRSPATCLTGVGELRGGDRLTVGSGEVLRHTLWSPWTFVRPERQFATTEDAAAAIRAASQRAVAGRVSAFGRVVLMISGGLDSSIAATCLAAAGARFDCLNLIAGDAESDERGYARVMAEATGARLVVRRLETRLVDPAQSGAARLPYPVHRCFTQAQDRIAAEMMAELGAGAVVDGGAGDNVFFASRSVAIPADALLESGVGRRFRNSAHCLADLAQVSVPAVIWKAAHRAWWRDRAPRQAPQDAYLSAGPRAALAQTPRHPWFVPPPDVLPGRAAHVALLAAAQSMTEATNAGMSFPLRSPLASQPVVEACLRTPSWAWLAPGHDRAAARAAFAAELPPLILNRRSKGTPTGFVARLYEAHRGEIRDLLLGGWLAEQRLIETGDVERAIGDAGPAPDVRVTALFGLVDAEAWARAHS